MPVKKAIKALLPQCVLNIVRKYRNKSTKQIFSKIYEYHVWGESGDSLQPFYSGSGSHDAYIVSTYVEAVQEFLASFDEKPNVVDLGCGDFYVGSQLRSLCNTYVACDIVPDLIEFNKEKYSSLDVDFRVLDLTADRLPEGDVVFVRQVLQHLSNRKISRAVKKLRSRYRYLVLTEHLPGSEDFVHNLDKQVGPDIRIAKNSGVVLTSPPFDLRPQSERKLCQVPEFGGLIVTTLYQLSV